MTVDYEAWRFWRDNLQLAFTVILGLYVWWSNREKVTSSRFLSLEKEVAKRATATELEKAKEVAATGLEGVKAEVRKHQEERCGQHLTRTSKLEIQIENTPTHAHLGDIHERINGVKGSVDEMTGLMRAMAPQIKLLVEHHINGGGK